MQKTYMQSHTKVEREWHLIDLSDHIVGRIATKIAGILIGKHKPTYTPHVDGGDYVVVINAEKLKLTRNKNVKKLYRWHTGYPGGLKERNFNEMMAKHPEEVIRRAVINMLPKNRTRKNRMARLKIYVGDKHNHQSQLKKVN